MQLSPFSGQAIRVLDELQPSALFVMRHVGSLEAASLQQTAVSSGRPQVDLTTPSRT
jgi:hypothetical protein